MTIHANGRNDGFSQSDQIRPIGAAGNRIFRQIYAVFGDRGHSRFCQFPHFHLYQHWRMNAIILLHLMTP